jgi:hypothetical protein
LSSERRPAHFYLAALFVCSIQCCNDSTEQTRAATPPVFLTTNNMHSATANSDNIEQPRSTTAAAMKRSD